MSSGGAAGAAASTAGNAGSAGHAAMGNAQAGMGAAAAGNAGTSNGGSGGGENWTGASGHAGQGDGGFGQGGASSIPPPPGAKLSPACGLQPVTASQSNTLDQIRAELAGDWLRCTNGGTSFFSGPGELGVSFDADGNFYHLVDAPGGGYVRAPTPAGQWALDPLTIGTGKFQLAGGYGIEGKLMACPRQLTFDVIGTDLVAYGGATSPTCALPTPTPIPLTYPASACSAPLGPSVPLPTTSSQAAIDVQTKALVGRWTACGAASPDLGGFPSAGIELSEDGSYHVLLPDGPGHVVEGVALGQHGTWSLAYANADMFQLDVSGGSAVLATMEGCPRRFHVLGASQHYVYASDDGGACSVPANPTVPFSSPAAACQALPTFIDPKSAADMTSLLTGRWSLCTGTPAFELGPQNDVGLELAADGTWYRLFPSSTPGSAEQGHAIFETGHWSVSWNGGNPNIANQLMLGGLVGGPVVQIAPSPHVIDMGGVRYARDD